MKANKILFIAQEIVPFTESSAIADNCRYLLQATQERGHEIRTFMPKWGNINERRNQLHEVIRLSGMNLIIDDDDHQLIIKVASIPSARIQIYFIDNDDYFERKAVLVDENGEEFADNDERAIFFARGVLETVKKLNWTPTVVHCLGWMSAITPIYLKKVFHDDPLFRDVKIVVTLCDDKFEKQLSDNFKEKIASEGVNDPKLEDFSIPSYENLYRFVIDYADGVVIASQKADASLVEYARQSGKPLLEYNNPDEAECFDNYNRFYENL